MIRFEGKAVIVTVTAGVTDRDPAVCTIPVVALIRRSPRRCLLSIVALAVMAATASVSSHTSAQNEAEEIAEARAGIAERKQDVTGLRDERASLAEETAFAAAAIDVLNADDQAVAESLAILDGFIAGQEAAIVQTDAEIAAASADAATARADAERLAAEIVEIGERLRQSVIDVFIQPRGDVVNQLATDDLGKTAVRRYLLDQVVGSELEIGDALRTAESELEAARVRALDRAAEAEAQRELKSQQLAALEEWRGQAEILRADVQRRIAEWEQQSADIEASDSELATEIRQIQGEIDQLEEQARRREEELRRREAEEAERQRREAEEAARRRAEEELRAAGRSDPSAFQLVVWPGDGKVTSGFGIRVHPIFGRTRQHNGIDIDGDRGDRVKAARSGEVIVSGWKNGFGNTVVLYHGDGFSTLYAHLSAISVRTDDSVASGDKIGEVGSTGWSTGSHLHFEVRVDGIAINPMPFLP